MAVVAPAGDGPVSPHATRVEATCADGDERADGRRGLAVLVPAPASDSAVGPQNARMEATRAEATWWIGRLRRVLLRSICLRG
jgi:hypothetical protein